jgi:hypothetical protein
MAQSGYTPIQTYYSITPSAAPSAGSLADGELAINIADGKLYYKDNLGVVQTIASKDGNVNVSSFSGGTTGFTPSTATTGAVTLSGTLITSNGGTGLTSFTAGDVPYYATGTALSKLAIGAANTVLTSSGTAPQWSTSLTLGGGISVGGQIKETVYALSGTTPALNPTNGTIQTWTLTGNSSPTDSLTSGQSMTLMVAAGVSYSVTWPTITWIGGSAPVLSTTGYTVIEIWKVSTTLYAALVGNT